MRPFEVHFDGSTAPGTVVLNGTKMTFETDEDAKRIHYLLTRVRDDIGYRELQAKVVIDALDALAADAFRRLR